MKINHWVFAAVVTYSVIGCSDEKVIEVNNMKQGKYTRETISQLPGFNEEKTALLSQWNVSEKTFISLSTDSAWALKTEEQTVLKNIRNGVSKPDAKTLLQKVIPLEDLSIYMNNIYGGTIGGFVAEAADVKSIYTMHDVYWGFRLDYAGTKFFENGAGYAIIRFYSSSASKLKIPFSPELGGTQAHSWPNGGGGFTTSTLGDGGYPEWVCDGYNAPEEGAELFEVTPQGQELLRSVYTKGKWQTYEYPETRNAMLPTIRNGVFDGKFITTYCEYEGYPFIIRGEVDGQYHLTTTEQVPVSGLKVVERGIYGVQVSKEAVKHVHETITNL